jgi:predicted Zn-dependent protease
MNRRLRFLLVLAVLIATTVVATLRPGRSDVSLASVRQLWSDTLRDADQPGMRLTRLSASEEMQLGVDLLRTIPWTEDPAAAPRLVRVAQPMLPHVHRGNIVYQFHVVRAPMINALALPGGQILVTDAMLGFVQSDSELAEILGHEMAHVDLRHAVEHYQYQYRLGALVELFHRLATMPFSADQELDADAEGLRLALAAGYDPAAGPALFARMQQHFHETAKPPATTPAGEFAHSLGDALASYFRSHPPSEERARRLRELADGARARQASRKP